MNDSVALTSDSNVANESQEAQKEFLYNAINDTQDTIRAIDIKLHILLAIMVVPLAEGIRIFHVFNLYSPEGVCIKDLLYHGICAISWLIAFLFTMNGIRAISNPQNHVDRGSYSVSGIFYGASHWRDKISLTKLIADLPNSIPFALNELAYEHAKLIYIREIKIKRQKYAVLFFTAWIALNVILMFFCEDCNGLNSGK